MADYDLRFDSSTGTYGASGGGGGLQLMFFAQLTSSVPNVTGYGAAYTIIYDSAPVNVGTCYDTSTGVFTVPSNGNYTFQFGSFLSNISSTHTSCENHICNLTQSSAIAITSSCNIYAIMSQFTAAYQFLGNVFSFPFASVLGDQIVNRVLVDGSNGDITIQGSTADLRT